MFVGSAFTVGRQDFSIRSMDPLTGKERWNVTYSRLGIGGGPAIASTGGPLPLQTGTCAGVYRGAVGWQSSTALAVGPAAESHAAQADTLPERAFSLG